VSSQGLIIIGVVLYIASVITWGWFMSKIIHLPYTDYVDMITFHFKTKCWRCMTIGVVLLALAPLFLVPCAAIWIVGIASKTGDLKWLDDEDQ
jgi:flagellar biosynthesis protein FlhB